MLSNGLLKLTMKMFLTKGNVKIYPWANNIKLSTNIMLKVKIIFSLNFFNLGCLLVLIRE